LASCRSIKRSKEAANMRQIIIIDAKIIKQT
jgi:hypothetical protein